MDEPAGKKVYKKSRHEDLLEEALKFNGFDDFIREHGFLEGTKHAFDFASPTRKIAIEVQGGLWINGRHTRPAALEVEYMKLNFAAIMGWTVLLITPAQIKSQEIFEYIRMLTEKNYLSDTERNEFFVNSFRRRKPTRKKKKTNPVKETE